MEEKKYVGVKFSERTKLFYSEINYQGVLYKCGSAKTARQAAINRDMTIIRHNMPTKRLQVLKPKQ